MSNYARSIRQQLVAVEFDTSVWGEGRAILRNKALLAIDNALEQGVMYTTNLGRNIAITLEGMCRFYSIDMPVLMRAYGEEYMVLHKSPRAQEIAKMFIQVVRSQRRLAGVELTAWRRDYDDRTRIPREISGHMEDTLASIRNQPDKVAFFNATELARIDNLRQRIADGDMVWAQFGSDQWKT